MCFRSLTVLGITSWVGEYLGRVLAVFRWVVAIPGRSKFEERLKLDRACYGGCADSGNNRKTNQHGQFRCLRGSIAIKTDKCVPQV